ncbi:MAG: SagB/ThcOx family dehydrogenase [Gemmatimonadales bacterium]|nr:MAG: SagB/ThcOx family dehydrogenase [Gemmatimonadales bacterium]
MDLISLPDPQLSGEMPLEEAIHGRRSIRSFRPDALDLRQVSQFLWAAQGITDPEGLRSAPSAGATYPLEVYLVASAVEELDSGVYRYDPTAHGLLPVGPGDRSEEVAEAALDQRWIADAPLILVLAADMGRTTGRYGERGRRYVYMEMGHAAQNVYLQAEALGLGTTLVGAFRDGDLAEALGLPSKEEPLGILPVGVPSP